ncbi:MAG: hypothetical protein AAGK00_14395 [Pseudomonadota bacterium]
MFHMHSMFDLRPNHTLQDFSAAWRALIQAMMAEDLIVSASGIGERRRDTPLDTDDSNDRRYFTVMRFRDRAQS